MNQLISIRNICAVLGALFLIRTSPLHGQITTFPVVEAFDFESPGGTNCGDLQTLSNPVWYNAPGDMLDWVAHSGPTSTPNTGPS
ncbi:MAG: hypothetical protein AAF570_13705, partial [Bacteroidota bacterium]